MVQYEAVYYSVEGGGYQRNSLGNEHYDELKKPNGREKESD
jgi:hypothetical protein